jgi:ubiquinone/menaquinone biosynthesis C-methylase UbiE
MAKRKPWYQTLFERDYYDYFYVGGPRGVIARRGADRAAIAITREQRDRIDDAQVDFIVRALELPEGARVLDLCCGWGRHSVRLAQRAYRVTGLDLSAYHLRLAKAAAQMAGVEVDLIHADMREIPRGRRFDAAINCFTSFGYFDDEADNQRVLNGVARALKPGGRFFIDTINHDGLMRVFRESDCTRRPDDALSIELRRYDPLTGRINVDWVYLEADGGQRKAFHSVRIYRYVELAAMLSEAGLTPVRAWGGFDGSELTLQSPRLVVLAAKA